MNFHKRKVVLETTPYHFTPLRYRESLRKVSIYWSLVDNRVRQVPPRLTVNCIYTT